MSKYILVGEMHGTNESPRVALALLKKHNIRLLALELPR